MDGTVLLADDDRTIRTVLTQALTRAGCKVHATSSLTTLMRWVAEGRGDLVITDVSMPDGNGLEMLPKISQERPDLPVIVISAQNTIMTAIKAAEAEAFDYLPKPFDLPDLMKRCARGLSQAAPRQTGLAPSDDPEEALPLVGRTAVMQDLFRLVARMMQVDLPLLIWGESGTGKSLIARVVHDFSDRRASPFIKLEPEDLDDPGAPARFLAALGGGTLLIDEIGDLSVAQQGLLVRMMDADNADQPRFVATSRRDLSAGLRDGTLRDDLFYRLSGAALHVPPLRDRAEDIAVLARHFLAQGGPSARQLAPDAVAVLTHFPWPGNVRQLENLIVRLTMTGQDGTITQPEIAAIFAAQPATPEPTETVTSDRLGASVARHLQRYFDQHGGMLPASGLYDRILHEIEVPLIEIALAATAGNQAKCAELLGINRNTLRKKITQLEIEVTRGRKMM